MFCSNCGNEVTGKFCSNCGTPVGAESKPATLAAQPAPSNEEVVLFECHPAGLVDKAKSQMNVNATVYRLTNQRVIIENGLLSRKQEEIELNRIKDFSVKQSLTEKLMRIGNIEIISTDSRSPKLILSNIENPFEMKDKIRSAMIDNKKQFNVIYHENF